MIHSIFGIRGHGKTTLASSFLVNPAKPVIALDFLDQFKGRLFTSTRELLRYLIKNGGAKLNEPLRISIFDDPEEFETLCNILIEHKGLTFIVDEVDFFDSPHSTCKAFKKIIHLGRHRDYDIDLITTSRRPHNVSRDLTSQTELFYIFKIVEKRDLDYFKEIDSRLPTIIRHLPKFEYIEYDLENFVNKKVLPMKKPSKRRISKA